MQTSAGRKAPKHRAISWRVHRGEVTFTVPRYGVCGHDTSELLAEERSPGGAVVLQYSLGRRTWSTLLASTITSHHAS